MEKQIIIIQCTIKVEVDERVVNYSNAKACKEVGCFRVIESDVHLSTESGIVCNDKAALEEVKQALIYGLEEKG